LPLNDNFLVDQQEEHFGKLGEELKSVSGLLNSLLVTSKKDTKQLDELIKNSHTDGKMLSNWNIQLQSMKVGLMSYGT
jgi:hypothetical protein